MIIQTSKRNISFTVQVPPAFASTLSTLEHMCSRSFQEHNSQCTRPPLLFVILDQASANLELGTVESNSSQIPNSFKAEPSPDCTYYPWRQQVNSSPLPPESSFHETSLWRLRLQLQTMPLLHLLTQHLVHKSMLLDDREALKLLRDNVERIHGSASAGNILNLQPKVSLSYRSSSNGLRAAVLSNLPLIS